MWRAISGLKTDSVKAAHQASSGDATLALLDGEVEITCGSVLLMVPPIKSGRLRGLFSTYPPADDRSSIYAFAAMASLVTLLLAAAVFWVGRSQRCLLASQHE